MRLFVAISLPDELRAQLGQLANGLPGARWVNEDSLHLTLRFLGELDGALAADVDEALASLRMPAFDLDLAGVDHFAEGRKVRCLWAGVRPNEALTRLHDKVEQAVIRAGLPPDKRKYRPHVTLARFKSDPGVKLHDYLAQYALFKAPSFCVDRFCLFSSYLSGEGAIYNVEAEYPLEGAPVPLHQDH